MDIDYVARLGLHQDIPALEVYYYLLFEQQLTYIQTYSIPHKLLLS